MSRGVEGRLEFFENSSDLVAGPFSYSQWNDKLMWLFLWAKNSDGFDGNNKLCYLRRPSQYVIPAFSTKVPRAKGFNNIEDDLGWAGSSIGMKMCKTICRSFYQLLLGLVAVFLTCVTFCTTFYKETHFLAQHLKIHNKKEKDDNVTLCLYFAL